MKLNESQLRRLVKGMIKESFSLQGLYDKVGLTPEESVQMPDFLSGELDFYGTSQFQKFYEFFLTNGEMPIGVAKARTGDPDLWILDYIKRRERRQGL